MDARKGSQGSELHFEVGGWGWAGLRPAEGVCVNMCRHESVLGVGLTGRGVPCESEILCSPWGPVTAYESQRMDPLPGRLPLSESSKVYGEPTARLALTLSSHCSQVFATEGLSLTQERGV